MIVFDLRCPNAHVFEAWFGSTSEYQDQKDRGLVACPICGDHNIDKAVMAPAVSPKGNRVVTDRERKADLQKLAAFQAEVESSCDYVGKNFVSEARARHEKGDEQPDARGIYGEASLADAVELLEEGIAVAPLPFRPRATADA